MNDEENEKKERKKNNEEQNKNEKSYTYRNDMCSCTICNVYSDLILVTKTIKLIAHD